MKTEPPIQSIAKLDRSVGALSIRKLKRENSHEWTGIKHAPRYGKSVKLGKFPLLPLIYLNPSKGYLFILKQTLSRSIGLVQDMDIILQKVTS